MLTMTVDQRMTTMHLRSGNGEVASKRMRDLCEPFPAEMHQVVPSNAVIMPHYPCPDRQSYPRDTMPRSDLPLQWYAFSRPGMQEVTLRHGRDGPVLRSGRAGLLQDETIMLSTPGAHDLARKGSEYPRVDGYGRDDHQCTQFDEKFRGARDPEIYQTKKGPSHAISDESAFRCGRRIGIDTHRVAHGCESSRHHADATSCCMARGCGIRPLPSSPA